LGDLVLFKVHRMCPVFFDSAGATVQPRAAAHDPFHRRLSGELAVITSYFNPCQYWALKRNYQRFAVALRAQGAVLHTIELTLGDAPFFLEPDPYVVQLRADDVMWQKERLLNLLIPRLPAYVDKVAWIDADVYFSNPDWMAEASRRLEQWPVIQLFDHVELLDREGRPAERFAGVAFAVAKNLPYARHIGKTQPGFAWGARRELLARHGLFDSHVLGSGDTLAVLGMFGWWDNFYLARFNAPLREACVEWGEKFWREVQGHVGYVPGMIRHLWHGARSNRKYVERLEWLLAANFDPRVDLAAAANGVWRWASPKHQLHRQVREYFAGRREDD
jgi:hypothetical protein